ncbi:hypothetical protein Tco_1573979, partial [Tanacetum coccineum]
LLSVVEFFLLGYDDADIIILEDVPGEIKNSKRSALGNTVRDKSIEESKLPENLFRDKSSNHNPVKLEMDFGISPEKSFSETARYWMLVVLPMFSGNSPEKLFRDKSRTYNSFCDEILSGIWPEIPQEVIEMYSRLHLGSTLVVLFQIKLLPFPPMYNSLRVLILNNKVGISPANMLSASQRDSNLLKFCIDDGIGPVNWLLLRPRKVKLVSLPVKVRISN